MTTAETTATAETTVTGTKVTAEATVTDTITTRIAMAAAHLVLRT
ncbi:hypothetical protein [uncultured Amphritea sp.]|nr:hypothetical protein [uncultured Amphritea sp.]